ncbi:MAG: hypothetical protein DRI34_14630 [Deltaproteobacteria bacterium]|nr:MAG: hypothetical protein DRI34_14630 [Deltaproteobacteria bacterium]
MYVIHPELKIIPGSAEHIVAIIESINSPMVAAEGRPLEPAKAYIVGLRNSSGLFSIYIYLHLIQSADCLIYLHDPVEVPMDAYHDTELEALQFVESMGFMVDNVNFRNLDQQQQGEVLDRMPIFQQDLQAFSQRQQGQSETGEEQEDGEAGEEVLELEPLEEVAAPESAVLSGEELKKIVRMLSSF